MSIYITSSSIVSPQPSFNDENWLNQTIAHDKVILKCIEPEYKEFISPAQLRRLPRVLKIGLYTALKCILKSTKPDAIIIGTGSGCLEELEKFMTQVIDNNGGVLSPAAFILSTSNLVGSQIAMATENSNYNMNYVNRSFAFENALTDAMMMIEEGNAKNVLTGAIDEVTDYHFKIFGYLNYWKNNGFRSEELYKTNSSGTIAGEGCAFFNLSSVPINQSIKLEGIQTIYNPDGQNEIKVKLNAFLESLDFSIADIDLLISGNNGDNNFDSIYDEFIQINFNSNLPTIFYKALCGEYYTSSAFALAIALHILKFKKIPKAVHLTNKPKKEIKTILIYNQFRNKEHSFIIVTKE